MMEVRETVDPKRGRHRMKVYDFADSREAEEQAKADFALFCRRFSDESHIKPKYVKYIIKAFIATFRGMIADGFMVKLPGIGDFFIGSELRNPEQFTREPFTRYTPLFKQYIYSGVKPKVVFRISKKWKEALNREYIEQDLCIVDPIAFPKKPSNRYLRFCIEKNNKLRLAENERGRTSRPKPIYTPDDIDRLCEEYGLWYMNFEGVKYKDEYENQFLTKKEVIQAIMEFRAKRRLEDETVNQGNKD